MRKITLLMLMAFTTITVQTQNKLLSSIQEYNNNGTWEKSYGTNYEYDSNNNLVIETELLWSGGVWKRSRIQTYTYNAGNKVTQDTYEDWNPQTNVVDYKERNIYSYTNGRLTSIVSQELMGSNWENDYKFVITYNTNNLPDTVLSYNWVGSQWVNDELTTYTYNVNNRLSTDVFQEWVGSQWVNSSKSIYTYNANNKLITERGANWDEFNNIWVEAGAYRADYELDATGNRFSETQSGGYNYKEEYTYDNSALMSNFAHPFKDKTGLDYFTEDFPYVNKLLTETSNGGTSRTTYNYNNLITLDNYSPEIVDKGITVYPNPTTDYINIQNESNIIIDKVIVTDLTGKKVLEQNKTSQVDVENLAKGMYLVQAISSTNKYQTKFVKD